MSDTERTVKKCKLCAKRFAVYDPSEWGHVLDHYASEHPESDLIERVVRDACIRSVCDGCDTEFVGDLRFCEDHLAVDAYCEDCIEEDYIRGLVVDPIPGKLAVDRSVEPGTSQDGDAR